MVFAIDDGDVQVADVPQSACSIESGKTRADDNDLLHHPLLASS